MNHLVISLRCRHCLISKKNKNKYSFHNKYKKKMTFLIFKFYDHHRSTRRLLHNHFIFVIYSVWLIHTTITNISSSNAFIISSTTSSKSNIVRRNAPFDTTIMTTEKCYFHANGKTTDSKSIFYGQCMSMNGPDGCCLEGHYKPGICTNLGHICCIKPDPECNAMFTNKGMLSRINFQLYFNPKNSIKLENRYNQISIETIWSSISEVQSRFNYEK